MATLRNPVAGAVAIVGLGHTEQGELPGRSVEDNAVEAGLQALADAGLTVADLDGLIGEVAQPLLVQKREPDNGVS